MKILFLGDVVGRSGRDGVARHLPELRSRLAPDFIVLNVDNAAAGYGVTEKIALEFFALGVDCLTGGNHVWDQREMLSAIERTPRVLRAINCPEGTPGKGFVILESRPGGPKLMVVHAMARLYMDTLDDPFAALDRLLRQHRMGPGGLGAIMLDFHGEASSEKMAMGHFLDGRVSLVVGTHTHIPTADAQILPGGTAYQTDAGMCADYDSVIGMKKEICIPRFTRKLPGERMVPAENEATICGLWLETDDRTGLAVRAEPVRVGGRLAGYVPEV